MGGGSVLAARWQHTRSTDIDLFFARDAVERLPLGAVLEGFERLSAASEVAGMLVYPGQGFHCRRGSTPISFMATDLLLPGTGADEFVADSGVRAEPSAEILLKKIRARMLRGEGYLARDAYDFVVAHVEEPDAVAAALDALATHERAALAYDGRAAHLPIEVDHRVANPAYRRLADSTEVLERYLRLALTGSMGGPEIAALARERSGGGGG